MKRRIFFIIVSDAPRPKIELKESARLADAYKQLRRGKASCLTDRRERLYW